MFQNKKHALNQLVEVDELKSTENKDLVDGFCQSGLFAIVRKPNYAAEQLVWISYYFFSVAASASATWPQSQGGTVTWVNWSIGGFILLCLLFQGPGWLIEQISISKYPVYREYQRRVPLYMPKITTLWYFLFRNDREKGSKVE